MELDHLFCISIAQRPVQRLGADAGLHALQRGKRLHVRGAEAQGGVDLQVEKPVLIEVAVRGEAHIRRGGAESHQEHHAQGNHRQNGNEAGLRRPDLPGKLCTQAFVHYHSILSTSTGLLLVQLSSTRPLRSRITRSPIGISAELWVIIKVVIPSRRQVSWSRRKTSLPVT